MGVLLSAEFATYTVCGIQKGIKWLSELHAWLKIVMAMGIPLLRPGLWLIQHFLSGFGTYLITLQLIAMTPNVAPGNLMNSGTVFYWGWL